MIKSLPYKFIVSNLIAMACLQTVHAQNEMLWYKQPATKWTEALPLGNGSLGAMVYGGVTEEHIQLNEETFWTGEPRQYARKGAVNHLVTLRSLLDEGKQKEAEDLATENFMGIRTHEEGYSERKESWTKLVTSTQPFAAKSLNDSQWETMTLPTLNGWESIGLQGLDGTVWFRQQVEIPAAWKGKSLIMDLGRIRDADRTFINGLLVGTNSVSSAHRRYTLKPNEWNPGSNFIAIQVINYFDKGGFTGRKTNDQRMIIYPEQEGPENAITIHNTWKYKIENDTPPPMPRFNADYQPFADLKLSMRHGNGVSDYKRWLDISNATAGVTYKVDNYQYTRNYFISAPNKVFTALFTTTNPAGLSITASLSSALKNYTFKKIDNRTLAIFVKPIDGKLTAVGMLRCNSKSKVNVKNGILNIEATDSILLQFSAATNFINYNDISGNAESKAAILLNAAKAITYATLFKNHVADYQDYYKRFTIWLGQTEHEKLPTDERIKQYNGLNDPSLITLYMQYARYLLISSSRPGTQPANLQGIWNDLVTPPWGSKYTMNINAEMNYWPATLLNLSECALPFAEMATELAAAGKVTAKEHYGAPGWVLHHNTDIWRGTAPVNASNHGVWPGGSAWVCHQLWEHYQFTGDTAFLRSKVYPVMREAAAFYHHFLVKDKATGWWVSTPSNSPEHGGMVKGPAMDHQLIRELYRHVIQAANILQIKDELLAGLKTQLPQIAPSQVGKHGQLQEWLTDLDDPQNQHRHVSHLWAVYPGADITWQDSTLMHAARQSLEYRGDDGTGWSIAWKVNLWARFKNGNRALVAINKLLEPADSESGATEKGGVYTNLFDAHPPFQIDGNFGGAAGIAEMLVQSHDGAIELLPALPETWNEGNVSGICARGNFMLDLKWENNTITDCWITAPTGGRTIVKYKQFSKAINLLPGERKQVLF